MNTEQSTARHNAWQDLAVLLEKTGLARHALFLNWGYLTEEMIVSAAPGELQGQLVRELLKDVPLAGRRVLDVGCGRGGAAALLVREYQPLSVTGLDLSPEHIRFCREHHGHPRLRFQVADACNLPQAEASCDVVMNLESSGAYADLPRFFSQVRRVLRPGGDFLYADIFPAATIAPVRAALTHLGFTLVSERSINAQVMASRRAAAPGLLMRFEALLAADSELAGQLQHYFALPGSPVYAAMARREADYHLFHWRREPQSPCLLFPDSLTEELDRRHQSLEQVLTGSATFCHQNSQDDHWFPLRMPDAKARVNVFALPYAGGGASIFRLWGEKTPDIPWPDGWQLCPVQLPGRENRINDDSFTDMASLILALARVIGPYTERPFALMGCSLGSKVAFELARHLEKQGIRPLMLFLMACPAPGIPVRQRASELDDPAFTDEVRRLGGTPPDVLANPQLMQIVSRALRADSRLAENYQAPAGTCTTTPIVLVSASDDALITLHDAWCWQAHAAGGMEHLLVTGGHFFLRTQRDSLQKWLIQRLQERLATQQVAELNLSTGAWLPYGSDCQPDEIRVFCFHHAGGSAASFHDWMGPGKQKGLRLCPLELPGRGRRFQENPWHDYQALVSAIIAVIEPFIHMPFALFGHSLGALLAFETACRLQKQYGNLPLSGLFISGRRPPHSAPALPLRHLLSDAALIKELAELGGTPGQILQNDELLALLFPVLRADFCVTETWPYQNAPADYGIFDCPIIACTGDTDAEVDPPLMAEWQRYGRGETALHVFSGGHFWLYQHTQALIQLMEKTLKESLCQVSTGQEMPGRSGIPQHRDS